MIWTDTITKDRYEIGAGLNANAKGEILTTCPKCSMDRIKRTQKCLSLNPQKGTGFCQHCQAKFVIPKESINHSRSRINHPLKPTADITPRQLNESELAYWGQYGISRKILEVYKVLAVDHYQAGSKRETTEKGNPIFCYHAGDMSYKIYRPSAIEGQNKFFWINSKPEGWLFGLNFCKGSERVYIAAGEKDVLTLICQGIEAFTLNSETATLPEDLVKKLKTQYKDINVLYDNDQTGIEASRMICKQNGFSRAILPEGIKDVSDLIKAGRSFDEIRYEAPPEDGFFICKPANQWTQEAQKTPPQPQLFGPFITQNELTIIFADPSAGKSVIITQIAANLCRGVPTMDLKNEAGPMIGIYFDFELSPKQFEKRNSDKEGNLYQFPDNFYRAETNGLAEVNDENLEDVIFNKIQEITNRYKANFIIIDNISWLHSEADKSKFAVPLMRKLKGMVKNQGITVIVINHTVKRNEAQAITANDMAGSKQLRALADMIWTIGRSPVNKDIRYLKMLKDNRTTGEIYGPDNVLVCELNKTDHLHFKYLTEAREVDYLPKFENREHSPKDDQKTTAKFLSGAGKSNVEIGKLLNVSEGTIRHWLK